MPLLESHKINKFRTSRKKSDLKLKFLVIGCLFVCYSVFESSRSLGKTENGERNPTGRALLFQEEEEEEEGREVNCIRSAMNEFPKDFFTLEQRRKGAVILHFTFACYLFTLMAFVCDDYFVPSIKTLCERLHLSEDVAGATFMAAATSSPELFVNIVGTFVTKGDIGIGTIVGSAVFNILAVPAFCGLLGDQKVKIDWWPLTRDCLAYGLTVILLIFFLLDGDIDWYEALVLVVLYVVYIIAMYYNDSVSKFIKTMLRKRKLYKEVPVLQHEATPLLQDNNKQRTDLNLQINKENGPQFISLICEEETNDSSAEALKNIPKGFWSKIFFFVSWPIAAILFLTIPNCKEESKKKYWPFTFIMCIVWIASTSYLVSWMITIMGNTLSIPDSVMGLTFLAAGMSVPEATSSIIVTNQGLGAMGISSSIGSNTFDILLCLGFPWLIKSTFLPTEPGKHIVKINSQGLGYSAMSLLTTLGLLYIAFAINNFTVDRKIGFICFILYISFTILASLIELNIFFNVNLPTCKS